MFQKGNKIATKNKGKKQKRTYIAESFGLNWTNAESILEKNIMEFITSPNAKTRLTALNMFSKYIKPAKSEQKIALMNFEEYLNEQNKQLQANKPEISLPNEPEDPTALQLPEAIPNDSTKS